MAPTVANASSGVETFPADKSSKNKRKFRADPPMEDPNNSASLSDNDLPPHEFPSPKNKATQIQENHTCCEICTGLRNENVNPQNLGINLPTADVAKDWVDWALLTTSELEKLVISNLEMMLKGAIKKIVAFGYREELVNRAVLRVNSYYGNKDMVSNIIDNTISFIQNAHENDFLKEIYFEDLEDMKRQVLSQLVCGFRELKPSFSVGDALWLLLLGDMSTVGACLLVDGSLSETPGLKFGFSGSSTLIPCSQSCNLVKTQTSPIGQISLTDEIKPEKATIGITKDPMFRQKPRNYGPKGSSRPGKKLSSFSGLVLDKKIRPVSNVKTSRVKISKTPLVDKPQVTETETEPSSDPPKILSSTTDLSSTEPDSKPDTELSLCPSRNKDVILMILSSRERDLKEKLDKWDEWAKQKVMQATKRLGKDKAELKALRLEREDTERVRREKKAVEENTMKKLFEMDNHLRKTAVQMERANLAVRRLEGENVWLRREMEVARENAREAAARLMEGVKREKEGAARAAKWEKEKGVFKEELVSEKRKRERLDKEVKLAKDRRDQQEARLKQEESAKELLLKEASSIRREKEELEASTKQEKQTIKSNAVTNLQKFKDEIANLEKEIADLRLKNDASKIAALRRGVEKLTPEEAHIRDLSRRVMSDIDDVEEVKRDRECAMCLSEERTVIFLPCAHQILCKDCNEIHEKQGVKDCPSCRTVIQQRICVRYVGKSK